MIYIDKLIRHRPSLLKLWSHHSPTAHIELLKLGYFNNSLPKPLRLTNSKKKITKVQAYKTTVSCSHLVSPAHTYVNINRSKTKALNQKYHKNPP